MPDYSELRHYHTGIVVDDLAVAMSLWSDALGLHWAPPRIATNPLQCPAGVLGRDVRITYSIEGPHHIEPARGDHLSLPIRAWMPGCTTLASLGLTEERAEDLVRQAAG